VKSGDRVLSVRLSDGLSQAVLYRKEWTGPDGFPSACPTMCDKKIKKIRVGLLPKIRIVHCGTLSETQSRHKPYCTDDRRCRPEILGAIT